MGAKKIENNCISIDKATAKQIDDSVYATWYTCPNCEDDYIMADANYCPSCGMKINWIDYE